MGAWGMVAALIISLSVSFIVPNVGSLIERHHQKQQINTLELSAKENQ